MLVTETFVNRTKGYQFGESDPYEPYTDNVGRLFRDFQREYGRCEGRVYIDTPAGVQSIGWIFAKRMRYEDAQRGDPDAYYTREVWVSLLDTYEPQPPRIVYHNTGKAA